MSTVAWERILRASRAAAVLSIGGCSAFGSTTPSTPSARGELARMRAFYSSAAEYHDEGTARAERDQADVKFVTQFRRGDGVSFIASSPDGSQTRLLGTLEHARVVDVDGTQQGRLVNLAASLSGTSRLSARIIPPMLLGVDFCDCLDSPDARFAGVEVIRGRNVYKVLVGTPPDRVLGFWIDAEDGRLVRFRRDPGRAERAPRVFIEYRHP
jgi:hypothetical protein